MEIQKGKGSPTQRFLSTTKGKILKLLCGGRRTVADLAEHLDLTSNAVRAQIDRLTRDGLIQHVGARAGVRKPHAEYELTTKARGLFPRAYEPVLSSLMNLLVERLPRKKVEELLLESGRRLLANELGPIAAREPRTRLTEVLSRLNGAGVGIDVTEESDNTRIAACSCPLASVTANHAEICTLFADLLSEILQGQVTARCDRTGVPRCKFELMDDSEQARAR